MIIKSKISYFYITLYYKVYIIIHLLNGDKNE